MDSRDPASQFEEGLLDDCHVLGAAWEGLMHASVRPCIYTHIHTYIPTYVRAYIHTCVHIYVYIYIIQGHIIVTY